MIPPRLVLLLRSSVAHWIDDRISRRAAALAFYAGFSLSPLLLISIAIGGMVFGEAAVRSHVIGQLRALLGVDGALALETVIKNTHATMPGVLAAVAGAVTLLIGASGMFGELQDSLNAIWKVRKRAGRGWRGVLMDRFLSFALVVGACFLLLVSLVVDASLVAATSALAGGVPHAAGVKIGGLVLSFLAISSVFAVMFKTLPDARTRWLDVWLGSMVTAALFTVGKWLIGFYLGHNALASSYGAAGSFVVLLLWLYYSCQVLLFGAELTHAYAYHFGTPPVPKAAAVSVEDEATREALRAASRRTR